VTALFLSLRPRQWAKNGLVLAALVFSKHLFDPAYLIPGVVATLLFCFLSGAIYLLNDVLDREQDRLHPLKRLRPIASGLLSVGAALTASALIGLAVFYFSFRLSPSFGWVTVLYAALNIAYSLALKHLVILDVMAIAAGFLLRAIGGGLAIDVAISSWFILCTMLLSLFLGFVKRRQELILLDSGASGHRPILEEYIAPFLDQMISVVTAGALVTYALYTMSPEVMAKLGTSHLNLTVPFVVYGLLRYLYLVYRKGLGGSPAETLLSDAPLVINGMLWLVTLVGVLYYR